MANEPHILKKIPLGTNLDDIFGKVKTVNEIEPDTNGNIELPVDSSLSEISENPVENRAIASKLKDIDAEIITLYNLIEPFISDLEIKVNNLDSIDQTEVTDFYLNTITEGGVWRSTDLELTWSEDHKLWLDANKSPLYFDSSKREWIFDRTIQNFDGWDKPYDHIDGAIVFKCEGNAGNMTLELKGKNISVYPPIEIIETFTWFNNQI